MDLSITEKVNGRMLRKTLIAVSLAALFYAPAWSEVLSADAAYLSSNFYKQTWLKLTAVTCNVLLLSALLLPLIVVALRQERTTRVSVAQIAFLCFAIIPLSGIRRYFGHTFDFKYLAAHLGPIVLAMLCVPALALAGFIFLRAGLHRATRTAAALLLVLSPFILILYIQAASRLVAYAKAEKNPPHLASPLPTKEGRQVRVLWLIFDEFDQRLAFRERPASLYLPELDRLRNQSLVADNAYPPAGATLASVASLTTGKLIDSAKPVGPSELFIHLRDSNEWTAWNTQATTFSQARQAGFNTSVIGWYNPYCRLFSQTLTRCYADSAKVFDGPKHQRLTYYMGQQIDMSIRTVPMLFWLLSSLYQRIEGNDGLDDEASKALATSYVGLMDNVKKDAADPSIGLVFVHMSVPHPPHFYDRAEGQFSFNKKNSYLDGLALADKSLGEIRREMEKAGVWDSTVVLISGDHWWRANELWKHRPKDWANIWFNGEDGRIIDGQPDRRVPFILKLANQKEMKVYEHPFNTVLSNDLLLLVLRGEAINIDSVVSWLDKHRSVAELPHYDVN